MTNSLAILHRLISFDTVSHRSNLSLINYVEDYLRARNFRLHKIEDSKQDKAALYAEIGPQTEGGILLSAHSDVVPVADQEWSKPPFQLTRVGERLYGRGTTDMKGFLSEILALADRAHGMTLRAPLKLLISYDEEIGCLGMRHIQNHLPPILGNPELAIVGEPTEMQVAIGHKGKRAYHVDVTGQSGHSALAPNFVSALHIAVDFVKELRAMQTEISQFGHRDEHYAIPYSTIHVGTLNSGSALNIVPDKAELKIEMRHVAEDDPNSIENRFQEIAEILMQPYPNIAKIQLHCEASYPGLAIPIHDPAVALTQKWSGEKTCKVTFGTEAGFLSELGVPTVVCGPGSMTDQGHKPDESISMEELLKCSRMLEHALQHLL
jgi:acetylornithine deacetylase